MLHTNALFRRRSPSWGAWIETIISSAVIAAAALVAPPRGERGLKRLFIAARQPPSLSRSPSWGAWIETPLAAAESMDIAGRSPSWGAWIETQVYTNSRNGEQVAPPRGERGLKRRQLPLQKSIR